MGEDDRSPPHPAVRGRCRASTCGRACSSPPFTFSADARQYAERIDTRIIPVDGTELARLMIAHGVGVSPVAVYELKRVDSDFFAEE